jgi:hypothetical protein
MRPAASRKLIAGSRSASRFAPGAAVPAQREHGMGSLLDALGEELQSDRADA